MSQRSSFYSNPRADVRAHIEGKFANVLDVGCDTGEFSGSLKKEGMAIIVHGIELSPAAQEAEKALDRVFRVDLSFSSEGLPERHYDLVLCLDVLEHMQDPWAALARIRGLMKENGQLVMAIPNVRNFRVVLPLLLRGRWTYARTGLLDRTHLRFFTFSTAVELLTGAGFTIERSVSLSLKRFSKIWWLNTITFGIFQGLLEYQYLFFARPKHS